MYNDNHRLNLGGKNLSKSCPIALPSTYLLHVLGTFESKVQNKIFPVAYLSSNHMKSNTEPIKS